MTGRRCKRIDNSRNVYEALASTFGKILTIASRPIVNKLRHKKPHTSCGPSACRDLDQQLSPRPARLEPLVGPSGLLQVVCLFNDSLDLPIRHQAGNVRVVGCVDLCSTEFELTLSTTQEGRPEKDHQQVRDTEKVGSGANKDDLGIRFEVVMRLPVQVEIAPDGVEDEVELPAAPLEGGDDILCLVVKHLVRTERLAELDIWTGARRDHVAALCFCDLNAKGPGTAATTIDEDFVPRLCPADTLVCRKSSDAHTSRLLKGHGIGKWSTAVAADDEVVSQSPKVWRLQRAEDALTRLEVAMASGHDNTGKVE